MLVSQLFKDKNLLSHEWSTKSKLKWIGIWVNVKIDHKLKNICKKIEIFASKHLEVIHAFFVCQGGWYRIDFWFHIYKIQLIINTLVNDYWFIALTYIEHVLWSESKTKMNDLECVTMECNRNYKAYIVIQLQSPLISSECLLLVLCSEHLCNNFQVLPNSLCPPCTSISMILQR